MCHDKIHARATMVSCPHTPLKQRLLGVVLVFRTGVQYWKYYRISDVVSLNMQNSLLSCDKGF